MRYSQLKKSLEISVDPIYRLVGTDYYLINSALSEILSALKLSNPALNLVRLGTDVPTADLIAECNRLSFFPERRMVYAEGVKPISSGDKLTWSRYLESPNPLTCLVLSSETQTGLTGGVTVDCSPLDEGELMTWLKKRAADEGKLISNKNALTLIRYTRGNASLLRGELDKLFAYGGEEITAEAIDALTIRSEEYEIYELANKIGQKNVEGAMSVFKFLLSRGLEPSLLIAAVYGTLRKLFYISLNKDLTNEELAGYLGGKTYGIVRLRENAANFTTARLLKSIALCLAAESDIKKTASNKADRLELLILSLINV